MKFKPLLFLLCFVVLHLSGLSQVKTIERSIKWNTVKTKKELSSDGQVIRTFHYLNFSSAVYNDLNTFLPYYKELIKLENASNARVDLVDMQFENVSSSDLQSIEHSDKIPSEVSVAQSVQYERKVPFIRLSFIPLRRNPTTHVVERLLSFTIQITTLSAKATVKSRKSYTSASVLASGTWVKMRLQKDTIYKLTKSQLTDMGVTNPASASIYGNGGAMLSEVPGATRTDDLAEIPTYKVYASDGTLSYLLFYATGPTKWNYSKSSKVFLHTLNLYSDYAYYFITSDAGTAKKAVATASLTTNPTNTVSTYDDYSYHDANTRNLLSTGKQWLGEEFDSDLTQDFVFSFQNIVASSTAKLAYQVAAQSTSSSSFTVKENSTALTSVSVSSSTPGSESADEAKNSSGVVSFQNSASSITIELTYNKLSNSSALGYLDYLDLNVRKSLAFSSGALKFRDMNSASSGNISTFNISNANSNLVVWDVTDIHNVKQIGTTLSGTTLSFTVATDSLRQFVAFDYTASYPSPEYSGTGLGTVDNQDLHALSKLDMVIVTHPDFLANATQLAAIHTSQDGLNVGVVTTTQVYNEFSSGAPDVTAIRDFMKMLYDKAVSSSTTLPKYLLLFGDGSYDNKTSSTSNTNYIPTYQSSSSYNESTSFVCDDYFGLLDDNEDITDGLLDIGIGRLPVDNSDEASAILTKINNYLNVKYWGTWQNTLCFIADEYSGDSNGFVTHADSVARNVGKNYPFLNINKIYAGSYEVVTSVSGQRYPTVNTAINNQVDKGAAIINYTGHGGATGLSNAQLVTVADIESWDNLTKPSVFFTATCQFSRFDNYKQVSAGEYALFSSIGGAVALFSTTRIVYEDGNLTLNWNFYQYAFKRDADSVKYRLGDIMRLAKNATDRGVNQLNFTLLGDPALQLNYPDKYVVTDSINGHDPTHYMDTLRALSKVKIKGHLEVISGTKLSTYNGTVTPSVYDKESTITTLNNLGEGTFSYKMQNSILFRGLAKAVNGKFSFSFIVPKDINYSLGPGKISYFGTNSVINAKGCNKRFYVGGSSSSSLNDKTGPTIHLYLNDKSFVSGGTTNESPTILAIVEDSSGINTVSTGIGHDITAVLDDVTSNTLVLNDYYVADTNSYQKGTVKYPLTDLAKGTHTLTFKVWDVADNSSSETISFVVAESAGLALDHVLNYPNPFTTHTSFYFEQNQAGSDLDILIQVFTVAGKLVKSIETKVSSAPTRIGADPAIEWDGRDDFGDRIGRGVYIYRVKVKANGKTAEKFQKLVILK
jgi:hypothetical protein